jgi:hypothetical protein
MKSLSSIKNKFGLSQRIFNKKSFFKNFSSSIKIDPFGGIDLKDPIPNPNRLKGKIAIITGGSNGIGRATCELFEKSGVSGLMIADLDEVNGELLAKQLNDSRNSKIAKFIKTDMTDDKSIKNMVGETVKEFGD